MSLAVALSQGLKGVRLDKRIPWNQGYSDYSLFITSPHYIGTEKVTAVLNILFNRLLSSLDVLKLGGGFMR